MNLTPMTWIRLFAILISGALLALSFTDAKEKGKVTPAFICKLVGGLLFAVFAVFSYPIFSAIFSH